MTLHNKDARRIEKLKKRLGAPTKVDVLRSALDLLEARTDRSERVARWKSAAQLVAKNSQEVLQDFQPASRSKRE